METSANKNNHPIADSFEEYLENLSPEDVEKLYKEVETYSHIGPTVEEYFNYIDKMLYCEYT